MISVAFIQYLVVGLLDWFISNWTYNLAHPVLLVMIGLACYRIASILVMEEGPWSMFARYRQKRGIVVDGRGNVAVQPGPTAFACVKCMSVWVALWLCILPWQLSAVFAVSAIAIFWGYTAVRSN